MGETPEEDLAGLAEAIKASSRGWIEAVEIVSEDGTPITHYSDLEFNPEYVGAATAAICGAISAVIELLNTKNYKNVEIQLDDKRFLLMRKYRGYYVVCLTKPNPNLGFVNMILEAYLSRGEE